MLRAIVVGFIMGFLLVGVLRVAAVDEAGPQLTATSAMKPGAAVDMVADRACTRPLLPDLVLA